MPPIPIPTPFPLPTPDPSATLDTSPFWDVQNLSGAISAFQTIFEMAKQNYVVAAFVVLGLIALVIIWMSRFVGQRDSTI
jgi:hypothetical protein